MKIVTPLISDFDKEEIAPWSGSRLIDLHMATLPSKPFVRFFPSVVVSSTVAELIFDKLNLTK